MRKESMQKDEWKKREKEEKEWQSVGECQRERRIYREMIAEWGEKEKKERVI